MFQPVLLTVIHTDAHDNNQQQHVRDESRCHPHVPTWTLPRRDNVVTVKCWSVTFAMTAKPVSPLC